MANYKNYLFTSTKSSGNTLIKVIKPEMLKEFVKAVSVDESLGEEIALAIALSVSGGLRVSECLSIRRRDCEKVNGVWRIRINVLKKRTDLVTRDFTLIQEVNWLLEKIMAKKRYNEYLLKGQTRFSLHHTLTRKLELTPHSLRHSCVSFMMFKGLTDIQIASILKMSVNNVRNYIHSDGAGAFQRLWG